jgi:hypothetical protein
MKQHYTTLKLAIALVSFLFSASLLTAQTYVNQPYYTGFETGTLGSEWTTFSSLAGGEVQPIQSGVYTWSGMSADAFAGNYYLAMHYATGGTMNTTQADLHMDLQGEVGIRIYFKWSEWNEETQVEDGLFISDDGGTTFVKVLDFDGDATTDLEWQSFNMSLDSINSANGLSFTSTYIIRFQQYDNYYLGGGNDGYLIDELSVLLPCNTFSSITESTCAEYTVPSGDETHTSSGVYYDTIPNAAGCDSIITIDLSILQTTSSITETVCGTYIVPSGDEAYASTGVYEDTLVNAAGCDSLITIDLTVNQISQSTTSITACDSYEWTDGNTYTSTGTFTQTLQNIQGCDSIATLDLMVNAGPNMSISSSNSVDLTAVGTADSLEWIDCDNMTIMQTDGIDYTPTQNGNYAVVGFTLDGCSDTSDCFSVTTLALESEVLSKIKLFPNPATHEINIQVGFELKMIEILDVTGRIVLSTKDEVLDVSRLNKGSYIVNIYDLSGERYTKEFVKQ